MSVTGKTTFQNYFFRFIQFQIGAKSSFGNDENVEKSLWPVFQNTGFNQNIYFKCRYPSTVDVVNIETHDFLPEIVHDEIVAKGMG